MPGHEQDSIDFATSSPEEGVVDAGSVASNIPELRSRIDELDEAIARLLIERSAAVELISTIKHDAGMPIGDVRREQEILTRINDITDGHSGVFRIFSTILHESRAQQGEVPPARRPQSGIKRHKGTW